LVNAVTERFAQMPEGSKDAVDGVTASTRLLRIQQVSETLSVSSSMAFKLVATGQLRSIRIGRAIRIRPADLEAYIEQAARET
jgi:excisionase family DNA binding protein